VAKDETHRSKDWCDVCGSAFPASSDRSQGVRRRSVSELERTRRDLRTSLALALLSNRRAGRFAVAGPGNGRGSPVRVRQFRQPQHDCADFIHRLGDLDACLMPLEDTPVQAPYGEPAADGKNRDTAGRPDIAALDASFLQAGCQRADRVAAALPAQAASVFRCRPAGTGIRISDRAEFRPEITAAR